MLESCIQLCDYTIAYYACILSKDNIYKCTNSYFNISMFIKALFIVKINCRQRDRRLLFHKIVIDNVISKIFYISFSIS